MVSQSSDADRVAFLNTEQASVGMNRSDPQVVFDQDGAVVEKDVTVRA